jgi:hypothetical protein
LIDNFILPGISQVKKKQRPGKTTQVGLTFLEKKIIIFWSLGSAKIGVLDQSLQKKEHLSSIMYVLV